MIASAALQKAIYVALNGNITGPVFDEAIDRTVTPYTVIGETAAESPWDTHDSDGSEEFIVLHFWSRATGSTEVKGIMQEADALLHHQPLVLEAGSLVMLRRDFMTVLKEETVPGETWRHGVIRYRALIAES